VTPQAAAERTAARALGCTAFTLSSSTAPRMAPAALAASSTLYQTPASSEPRSCAYSGIWAWKALPTKNDVAPPSTIMVTSRRSARTSASRGQASRRRGGGRRPSGRAVCPV
jgi:hypothetical protein